MGRLDGKVAIVTGAAGGMGEAEARLMALEGAKVVMVDIKEELLLQSADNIKKAGGEVTPLVYDVSKMENWQKIVQTTIETYGLVNVLMNNAGFSPGNDIETFKQELWESTLGVILYGTVYGMHCCIPEMRKAGGGSIINCCSMTSFRAFHLFEKPVQGRGPDSPYCAAKSAVRGLTTAAAWQYGKDNIRVNAVAPGIIRTPIVSPIFSQEDSPIVKVWERRMVLPSGFGEADEVAQAVVFLASDEASHITGVVLPVDGGYLTA